MSQENVERVRQIIENFRAGKSEFDAEGMLTKIAGKDLMHPAIEWDASEAPFDLSGTYRGVEAVRQSLRSTERRPPPSQGSYCSFG
jgi:hypothetical protein